MKTVAIIFRKYLPTTTAVTIFLFWFLLSKDNYFHWDEWEYFLNFKDLPHYLLHQTHEQFAFIQIIYEFILFKTFGLVYWPFQLSENLLHAINCLLLYWIILKETKRKDLALIAMILFGFSSVSVENLNNSAAISQVLAGFFLFLSFRFFQEYRENGRLIFILASVILLILSPMGHGFTLLYPFAFAYCELISKKRKLKTIILYIVAGFVILSLTSIFGKKLSANIHFTLRYFLIDIPSFIIAGVIRGNLIRFFIPELYFISPNSIFFVQKFRESLRFVFHLIPILSLAAILLAGIYLRKISSFKDKFQQLISKLIFFLPLITIGYVAAAPTRASFGFNQAIITRYTYESFFFILILFATMLTIFHLKKKLLITIVLYLFTIHFFACLNFEKLYWYPIVDNERNFIVDMKYLFAHNEIVYDLPAKGIWPTITLSKLWFIIPKDHKIRFISAKHMPKNIKQIASDRHSEEIYKRLITKYNFKSY